MGTSGLWRMGLCVRERLKGSGACDDLAFYANFLNIISDKKKGMA